MTTSSPDRSVPDRSPDRPTAQPPARPSTQFQGSAHFHDLVGRDKIIHHHLPKTEVARPAHLPAITSMLVGRDSELAGLDELHRSTPSRVMRIIAITGMAGIGKTELATHWAHRVLDQFPDGQLYQNLNGYGEGEPTPPNVVLSHFLAALGEPPERTTGTLAENASRFRSLLAGRQVLVFLDNAASVQQIRPLLPSGPGCLVLITSRNRLVGLIAAHGAERRPLDPLTPGQAAALVTSVIGGERSAAEPVALARLARLCAGMPQALRIVAASLVARPQQRVAEMVAELSTGELMEALAVHDDPQYAIKATFRLSYEQLDPELRPTYARLGLIPGADFGPHAVAAMNGITVAEARRQLEQFADVHLVEPVGSDRYRLHDLLGLYARTRARALPGNAQALLRLISWYIHNTDAASRLLDQHFIRLRRWPVRGGGVVPDFTSQDEARAWLDTERANLVATVRHIDRHGPPWAGWHLVDALRAFFAVRRHMHDWLTTAEIGLRAAQESGGWRPQIAMLQNLAQVHSLLDRFDTARSELLAARELSRAARWDEAEASILNNLGNLAYLRGSTDDAIRYLTEAADVARSANAISIEANSHENLGISLRASGQCTVAVRHFSKSLALREAAGFGFDAASCLNYANTLREVGQLTLAETYLNRALRENQHTGDRGIETATLESLSLTLHYLGQSYSALDLAARARLLSRDIGSGIAEVESSLTIATVRCDIGDYGAAIELAEHFQLVAQEIGNDHLQVDALNVLTEARLRIGERDIAIHNQNQAHRLAHDTEYRLGHTRALCNLAMIEIDLQDFASAVDSSERALRASQNMGARLLEGRALLTLAHAHLGAQRYDTCQKVAEDALHSHRETKQAFGVIQALVVLGQAALASGQRRATAAHWTEALAQLPERPTPESYRIRRLIEDSGVTTPTTVEDSTTATTPAGRMEATSHVDSTAHPLL